MPFPEFAYPMSSDREILKPDIIRIAPEAPLGPSAADNCTIGTCLETTWCPDKCAYEPVSDHTQAKTPAPTPQRLGSICMK